MRYSLSNLKKAVIFGFLTAAVVLVMVFQNCAKSIDLGQYTAQSTTTCSLPNPLPWTVGASTCIVSTSSFQLNNGAQITVTADAPSTGSAIFDCTNGQLVPEATATCNLSCQAPAELTWKVGANTCTATGAMLVADGASVSVSQTTPEVGNAVFNCSKGQLLVNATATCAPIVSVTPVCGTANGQTLTVAPTGATLCAVGTASAVTGTGPWSWMCSGTGAAASCSAKLAPPVPPPTITTQPIGYTGCVGDGNDLKVVAVGTNVAVYPLSYQWYKDAVAITGATAATYFDSVTGGTNTFYVIVKNAAGSVQSTTVTDVGRGPVACGGGGGNK